MKTNTFKLNANTINKNRSYLFLALILICGIFVDKFYTVYNIWAVTGNGSLVIWLGIGFTVCLIAGHMDLTVMYMSTMGALLALGLRAQTGMPWIAGIIIATLVGVIVGVINGVLVTKLKIPSFVSTLGMQFVLRGAMYIYSGGAELSIGKDYSFNEILNAKFLGTPFSVYFIITTIAAFAIMIVLRYTRFGRNVYMVGGNLETAWLAGIKSDLTTIMAFVISAACCAFGGALNGIYSGAANITMGEKGISPLMIALTATIIGGTDVSGGKGSVIWTWVSLVAIAFLKCIFKKTEMQVLVIAIILMACVFYETLMKYRKDKVTGRRPNLYKEFLEETGKSN